MTIRNGGILFGCVFVCVLLLAGCGDDDAPYSCDRDSALLSEERDCVLDEDCPCGAHCGLGLCAHECESDGECGGTQWCDYFGRCRAGDDRDLIARASTDPRAVLQLDRTEVPFPPGFTEQTVWLTARAHDSGMVRLAARDDAVEVRCAPDGAFGPSCTIDNIAADATEPTPIALRLTSPTRPLEQTHHEVGLFAEGGIRQIIGVRVRPEAGPARVGETGLYRGHLRPLGGARAAMGDAWTELRIPVTVELFPDSGGVHVLTLKDDYGLLPTADGVGKTVGTLSLAGDLALPTMRYLGPASPDPTDIAVDVVFGGLPLTVTGTTLDGELTTTYQGATAPDRAPVMRWGLSVVRVDDLPADAVAPTVPPAVTTRVAADVAAVALPMEDALSGAGLPDLGTAATTIVERLLCTETGDATEVTLSPELLDLDDTAAVRYAASGDFACEPRPPRARGQLVFPLLASTAPLSAVTVLTRCITDLDAGAAATSLGTDGCVDEGRLVAAVAIGLTRDRDRALGITMAGPEIVASALSHRLLQQWLALHGAVASEGQQVENLQAVLGVGAPPADIALSSLDLSMRGGDLILHPRIATGLSAMVGQVLDAPDYRALIFPSASFTLHNSHDQPVGLPAALLATLQAQARSLDSVISQARFGLVPASAVDARLSELLRRAFLMHALASDLYWAVVDARTAAGRADVQPEWQPEWETAQLGSGAALARVFAALAELRAGSNPLGIEGQDLPLYRVGDETSAGSRIAALSDYLLGTGLEASPIVPTTLDRAEVNLEAARDSWVANLDRDFAQAHLDDDRSRRIEGVSRRYGEQIVSLCGHPAWDSSTVLSLPDDVLSGNSCFITAAAGCTPPPSADPFSQITNRDVGHYLCTAYELREAFGSAFSTGNATLDGMLSEIGPRLIRDGHFDLNCTGLTALPSGGHELECTVGGVSYALPDPGNTGLDYPDCSELVAGASCARAADCTGEGEGCWEGHCLARCSPMGDCAGSDSYCVEGFCRSRSAGCAQETLAAAREKCDAAASGGPDTTRFSDAHDRPECYQGALGEVALSVRAAAREVEIARQELSELSDRYDIAMRSCYIAEEGHWMIDEAISAHNGVMTALGAVKLAADITATVAGGVKDCANTAAGGSFDTPWSASISASAGVVACGAAAVETGARVVSDSLQYSMDVVERDHQLAMQRFERDIENRTCFNDAEMNLVGARTQSTRIQQAVLNLSRQLVEFQNLKDTVTGLVNEGRAALQNETDRRVPPLATDFWIDEHVQRFHDSFRQAQRVAYLAAVAVEYEFQLSTPERMEVLRARTPDELRAVVTRLRAHAATGQIGGASPNNDFAVISLRDELLQLQSRTAFPDGWPRLNARQRFGLWLNAEAHKVYGADGLLLGREIHFTVQPLGTLGIGDAAGIEILAGGDCAERLWSVNASLVGTDLFVGSDTTRSRVVLRKRNTFMSQWCATPSPDDTSFQRASVRPSRNLFLDPLGFGESMLPAVPRPGAAELDEASGFTDARVNAHFNITRAQLEDESYFNGDSQELAGRGLYGDYALFIEEERLSDPAAGRTNGLDLRNIEDILLRLDYVSVARGR